MQVHLQQRQVSWWLCLVSTHSWHFVMTSRVWTSWMLGVTHWPQSSPKVSAAFLGLVSKATCCLANDRGVVTFVLHQDFYRSTTSLAPGLARDHLSLPFGSFSTHPRQNILLCTANLSTLIVVKVLKVEYKKFE